LPQVHHRHQNFPGLRLLLQLGVPKQYRTISEFSSSRCCLHLSHSLKKLLGIMCVLLLCASSSLAATGKKTSRHHGSAPSRSQASKSAVRHRSTTSSHPASTVSRHSKSTHTRGKRTAKAKMPRGQRGIDDDRAREIQSALIREKYLEGDATGVWDQRTREALVRFQGDNGWQTKVVPDSRALIKLGLGPKHADLINPEAVGLPATATDLRPGGGPPQR
jgi:hypothetical protein